jgi:hypothetical protein
MARAQNPVGRGSLHRKGTAVAVDEDKLNELLGTFVTDVGGSYRAISAVFGDRLDLYRSLLAVLPGTPAEVAAEKSWEPPRQER